MSFAKALTEDRRLAILKLLIEAGGEANESVLRSGLALLGHNAQLTQENVRADLDHLANAGALRLSWFGDKVVVAKIARRGMDCAEGRIRIEGVKPPAIGD